MGWVDPLGLKCKENQPYAASPSGGSPSIPENYDPLTDVYTGVDLNFFSPNEGIHGFAKKVKNNENIFVVGGHGSPQGMSNDNIPGAPKRLTPEALATVIKNHPKYKQGMPVYLLSCNTGKGDNSFAEQLSAQMKTDVVAPDEILWYYPDGNVRPYARGADNPDLPDTSRPGNIRKFTPKK